MNSNTTVSTAFITTTNTSGFYINPNSILYNGSITIISIREVSFNTSVLAIKDSSNNVALELRATSRSSNNTGLGQNSLRLNTTGDNNTAIGANSLSVVTSGTSNTAIGSNSQRNNSNGTANASIGLYSLYYNQWGSANVAVGTYSLFFNQNSSNTAVGDSSLYSNTNGSENVAIGRNSLYYNTTGWGNTAVGRSSLINSTGSSNIAIGYQAGDNLTAGDTNIIIGYDIDAQSTTGSNQLSIGNVIFGGGGFGTGTTVGTGRIGIGGVQDGTDKLRVYGDVKVGTSGTNGCIKRFDGAALTGTCSSDERFKEEVTSMSGILNKVANLQAVTYKFNQLGKDYTGATGNEIQYGLIAQQVLQVAPELVSTDENGYLKLRYDLLPIYAIAAIGEQQTQITDAQDRLAALENSIQPASNNILDLTNGGTIQGNLNVVGNLNVTGPVTMSSLTVTDDVVIAGNLTVQNVTVANLTVNGHIITAGNTPTATVGTAAGVEDTNNNIPAPQVTIEGNDTAGTITIVAGANTTAGTLAEVTFNQAFGNTPKVVITGQDIDSASIQVFATPTANGFTFGTPNTTQTSKTYKYSYFVIE